MENQFKLLTEQEERQLCFEVNSRCQFHPEFYGELLLLLEKYEAPFEDDGHVRKLKPKFSTNESTTQRPD